jgi:endonuclease/exonuclease/phosphatase family metal-dependent hydrolase
MAQLRVMTWNVENLFDVGAEAGPDTQAQLAAKIESLRAVIDEQQPHVLALQEVGSESALAKLQAALQLPMPHLALAPPDDRGIRVAFISRRVLHDVTEVRLFPEGLLPVQAGDDPPGPDGPRLMNQMGRAALQVTVRASNRDVHVISAHLKSKLLTFPGGSFVPADEDQRARFAAYAVYRRASEATTLRAHLDNLLAGGGRDRPVILAGDLNDEVEAATTLILNGPPGSEIGSVGFDQPDQGDGDRMFNTAPLIPAERRFSRLYRGRMELIDHLFVSHFLASDTRLTDVTTVTAAAGIPSIEDDPLERVREPGSDHAAVVATFDF